jgi:CheY-like chemotaxis protein
VLNLLVNQQNGLHGEPTVLVVDDEELMREVTCMMIEDNGGHTLTAVDGADAIEVFRNNQENISAILMDFSMPRMNGYEAYVQIRKISDAIKVVMISGLNITEEVRTLQGRGDVMFLAKPFGEDELLNVINEVLAPEE